MKSTIPPGLMLPIGVGLVLVACQASRPAGTSRQLQYPESRRSAQEDGYFGRTVADPYRWLEDLDSPETAAWVAAQNDLAVPFLEQLPGRAAIEARLGELWRYESFDLPVVEGGRLFFERNDGTQDQSVLYVADGLDAPPRALIDPNRLSDDGTVALTDWEVSPDGRHVAFSLSDGGTDWDSWHVREVDSGRDLPDLVRWTKFTGASWARDGSGFYYSRYPLGEDGRGDDSRTVSVFFHRLGAPQEDDAHVYSVPGDTRRNPYGVVSEDGRWLVVQVQEGFSSNAVHVLDLTRPGTEARALFDAWDAIYEVLGSRGSTFYVFTNHSAPRGRVVAVELDDPSTGSWREVVSEAAETLEGASLVGGRIVCRYLADARSRVHVFELDGTEAGEVELPGLGTAEGFSGHDGSALTFFRFATFTEPPAIYRYDVASGESAVFRRPEAKVDPTPYVTEQRFFESRDGTAVPLFLVHRRELEKNGDNPTLLYGYGGFNISLTPSYEPRWLAWLEMGGTLAVVNLRGGGEYGEPWHLAGTKTHKQNVFDDFVAAAEYLIAEGYTSSSRLAIEGRSNGGLLVAAALTQRPDLFGAALPGVGVLDMMRYHLPSANARAWSSDYGLSENEQEAAALLAYSPVHNVRPGTCYPPTLLTTADHDDRVVPWHSYKMAAALQYAQGCEKPVLIRVETRAGHGAGKPIWMRVEEYAEQWAFLSAMLGMGAHRTE